MLLAELKVIWLEKSNNNAQFSSILPSDHVESVSHLQASTVIQQEQQSNNLELQCVIICHLVGRVCFRWLKFSNHVPDRDMESQLHDWYSIV